MKKKNQEVQDSRIYLSSPHIGDYEQKYVTDAFESNFIAPVGPQLQKFEIEFAKNVGSKYALAVSSGTAALHLILRYLNVKESDYVICSSFTFVASANPILYCGGKPIFIDCEATTWNMDPSLLEKALAKCYKSGVLPKAVVLVHLYGQPADIDNIIQICLNYNIPLIEDAAESLGSQYKGKSPGTFGIAGFYSFNGNKIITTSGGGMIVSDNKNLIDRLRFLSTQAKEQSIHYEHQEMGYNYRMSNVLAAIGRGQLRVLDDRVNRKRRIYKIYKKGLSDLPGITFMPENKVSMSTHWLSCITINSEKFGVHRNHIINILEKNNIESRPTWKPMHLQPLFSEYQMFGGEVCENLFTNGICLPSGTNMSNSDIERIITIIRSCYLG